MLDPNPQHSTQLRVRGVAQVRVHFIPEAEPEPPAVTRRIHELCSSGDVLFTMVKSTLTHINLPNCGSATLIITSKILRCDNNIVRSPFAKSLITRTQKLTYGTGNYNRNVLKIKQSLLEVPESKYSSLKLIKFMRIRITLKTRLRMRVKVKSKK
jgi:hypothetical protein